MGLESGAGLPRMSEIGDRGGSWSQNGAKGCYDRSSTFPPIATVLMVSVRSVANRNR